jgi:hypothetical protein
VSKRTTLTLDDDVATGLQREVRRSGRPLRSVVNDTIRAGLDARSESPGVPFQVRAGELGLREGLDVDDIAGLLDQIEGPTHR